LKWSRIERRFNGTWREGQSLAFSPDGKALAASIDRFGELSVRLVGNEIRGAQTTDAKSIINPATPRLADLTWWRTVLGNATDGTATDRSKAIEALRQLRELGEARLKVQNCSVPWGETRRALLGRETQVSCSGSSSSMGANYKRCSTRPWSSKSPSRRATCLKSSTGVSGDPQPTVDRRRANAFGELLIDRHDVHRRREEFVLGIAQLFRVSPESTGGPTTSAGRQASTWCTAIAAGAAYHKPAALEARGCSI